jgi:hypothetical protein
VVIRFMTGDASYNRNTRKYPQPSPDTTAGTGNLSRKFLSLSL